MKYYHMQIRYTINGKVEEYDVVYNATFNHLTTKVLLDWTDIEKAPSFEDMKKTVTKGRNEVFTQEIRMISDDGEHFSIGNNVNNNYPHCINHLHKK